MSLWSLTPPERDRLARRTAEMLALPEMVCDKRLCRRNRVCEFYDNKSSERWCLRRLTAEQRAAWDELHMIVIKIADQVRARQPSRDPRIRELEEAAIEIISAIELHDPVCHLFKIWLKAYRSGVSDVPAAQPDGCDSRPVQAPEEPDAGAADDEWTCDIAFADVEDPRLDWRTYR